MIDATVSYNVKPVNANVELQENDVLLNAIITQIVKTNNLTLIIK